MSVERLDQKTTTDQLQVALHRARYDFALEHVRGAVAVLEIGTGCGELSEELSKLPFEYTGVEIDAPSAARTRERLRGGGSILEADARDLPFSDGAFSHVICLEVLEHLGEYGGAISEIRRCLRPGGEAIISVPHRWEGGKNPQNPYHLYEPGEQELCSAFEREGFQLEVFYQYYEETWWMGLARRLRIRRLVGLHDRYRRLSEGDPRELQSLRIGKVPKGLISNLILVARKP